MKTDGVVRLDLSGFVDRGYLIVGDREISAVCRGPEPAGCRVLLDIGDAVKFTLMDSRLLEFLSEAESVTVIGSHWGAVSTAVGVFSSLRSLPSRGGAA